MKQGEHDNTRMNRVLFGRHEDVEMCHSDTFQEMACCPTAKSEVSRDPAITSLDVPQLQRDALFLPPASPTD